MKIYTLLKIRIALIGVLLFTTFVVSAQQLDPINSNLLIENGISPRLLDAAASAYMQDGNFMEDVTIKVDANGVKKEYQVLLIYDPAYHDGMDIGVVNKKGELSKKELKSLKKYIEKSHFFSRMSNSYLYDESTLKTIKNEGGSIVLEFYYKKTDVDPYLRYIKRIKGRFFINNGVLEKVVLTNTKPLHNHISYYHKEVFFSKVEQGGYIVSSIIEHIEMGKSGKKTKIEIASNTIDHKNKNVPLTWNTKNGAEPTYDEKDLITVDLGGTLPFLGKEATAINYLAQ